MEHAGIKKTADKVILLGKYKYSVYTSVKHKRNGDYYIKFEFRDLTNDQQNQLSHLGSIRQAIDLSSEFLEKKKYEINKVVVTRKRKIDQETLEWDCHSYKSFLIKET